MSTTESSGAPAEASATAPAAANFANAATFGNNQRGSGLARGKRPSAAAATASAPATGYQPTAIEVINAPREYQNPFAPVESSPAPATTLPVAATPEVAPAQPAVASVPVAPAPAAPTPAAPVAGHSAATTAAQIRAGVAQAGSDRAPELFPLDGPAAAETAAPTEDTTPAELNILPPERQRAAAPQTWESEGFSPAARASSTTRAPRESSEPRARRERRDEAPDQPIPEKFLYVRPGFTYVPTDLSQGRGAAPVAGDRSSAPRSRPAPGATATAAPGRSGGFFGWLKGLFGGAQPTRAGRRADGRCHRTPPRPLPPGRPRS